MFSGIKGIVLAGGKSRRFGEDKALAQVDGKSMLERAVDLLNELHLEPCVITSAERDYSFLKCEVRRDLIPGKGPLGGLAAACHLFQGKPLLLLTCDMPLLSKSSLITLTEAYTPENEIIVFENEAGLFQPFPGLYAPSLKTLIQTHLNEDKLSMQCLIQASARKKVLPLPPAHRNIFRNVNSKQDFTALYGLSRSL